MTLDGIPEAQRAARAAGMRFYPGVELYATIDGHELHVVGWDVDPGFEPLRAWLQLAQDEHRRWFDRTVTALQGIGFPIPPKAVAAIESSYPAFPHLHFLASRTATGRSILRRRFGRLPTLFEFINTYFHTGQEAAVPGRHRHITVVEAITLIHRAGGLAILAHPGQHLRWEEDGIIVRLARAGLDGIDVYHPYHSWHQIEHYQGLAIALRLVASGGSDFHAPLETGSMIRWPWEYFTVPLGVERALRSRRRQ